MKWLLSSLLLISSVALSNDDPPQIWSWFKDVDKSKEACEIQISSDLKGIGWEDRVVNEYGTYGVIKSNRIVVKCIEISSSKSKVWVAVSGHNKASVEILRNRILRLIN